MLWNIFIFFALTYVIDRIIFDIKNANRDKKN